MPITFIQFIGVKGFPEFSDAGQALVEAKLAEAERNIDIEVWGDQAEDGVCYLAAHLICTSPSGVMARLVSKDGSTTYLKRFKQMSMEVSSGYRVV